jgi:hypothetical protein
MDAEPETELMAWTAGQGSLSAAAETYTQAHPTRWVVMVETVDEKTIRIHSLQWPSENVSESVQS